MLEKFPLPILAGDKLLYRGEEQPQKAGRRGRAIETMAYRASKQIGETMFYTAPHPVRRTLMPTSRHRTAFLAALPILFTVLLAAQAKPRARELGVPFDGDPGAWNAITDVKGVEVGHTTLISGEGALKVGVGPVRTGVTAILPRGKDSNDAVFGGWFTENGSGEMTGTTWLEDSGFIDGPVMITNTHSVGVVHDAVIAWKVKSGKRDQEGYWWSAPVVAETWDGDLNDVNGFHVKQEHVFHAIETAHSGPVEEGNVGGGTGMICHEFKGGIGTASRVLSAKNGGYTVGVLVQCNYGDRNQLRIAGVPVGREIQDDKVRDKDVGSIIVVVATDAPLIPTQLKRVARHVALGLARNGSYGGNGSGDIFIAFSTANPGAISPRGLRQITMLPNDSLDPIFLATVQATEEAVVNALVAAETMTGIDNRTVVALPHGRLREVLSKYNRLEK
jgi:D-aminopeptidase